MVAVSYQQWRQYDPCTNCESAIALAMLLSMQKFTRVGGASSARNDKILNTKINTILCSTELSNEFWWNQETTSQSVRRELLNEFTLAHEDKWISF